tara:strand:- start:322 stop:954 length:633 start_codon:yes stop_codon:yes gene_type:complete
MKLNKKLQIKVSPGLTPYDEALTYMKNHVNHIKIENGEELIWFLEHEDVYTAGTSAKHEDQKIKNKNLIRYTGRGGQWTWHGQGQRVIYIMLDLKQREKDIKKYIKSLENWIIESLRNFSIYGLTLDKHPGVWIKKENGFHKIASIGVRISNWITWHGISINVHPDLSNFEKIIPCGIKESYVTSIKNEGVVINLNNLDKSLIKNLKNYF